MGVTIKLDYNAIKEIEKAAIESAELAMEKVKTDSNDTMPLDQGTLQSNYNVETRKIGNETHVFLDYNCIYARYLYFENKMVDSETGMGPALIHDKYGGTVGYRFRKNSTLKVKQPVEKLKFQNGRTGHWLEPYISGDKKDFVEETFCDIFKKRAGI